MQGGLRNVASQLRALGYARLAALAATGLATLGLLAAFALRVSEPPMALLYGELDTRDAAQVVAALERARVPHRIGRSSGEIYAPEDQIPRLRLTLAREGLPAGGSIGYEVFDRQGGLTATPFQQDINRMRALEGEIARTLRGLSNVSSARVHLVLPRRELFSRERSEAQASIVLQMRGSQQLDRDGVQSVLHLVSAAVPGLRPQNIAVVDGRGALLARGGRPLVGGEGADAGILPPHEELRRMQENRIARGLEDMLERALGQGRVRVEASLDFDTARQQTTEERFDPDNQVPRSQQSVSENNRNGEPANVSVANQLPGAPPAAAAPAGPTSQENRQEETTNFEIGRTTRTTVREQPLVRRISVAVLVDAVRVPGETPGAVATWRERTPEELARLSSLVRGAIGFDEQRGDRVEVVSMPFANATPDMGSGEPGASGWMEMLPPALLARIVESAMFGLLAMAALFVVLRPMMRRVTSLPLTIAPPPAVAIPPAAANGAAPAAALPAAGARGEEPMVSIAMVEGQMRASSVNQVGELADRHPDETLAIMRRWLAPQEQRA